MGGSSLFVRLARATPAALGFDAVLREVVVPALRARHSPVELWAGRHGPDELGERAIVVIEALEAADPPGAEATGGSAAGLPVDALRWEPPRPLRVDVRAGTAVRPAILRIAQGRVATVDLATYLRDVDAGARRDVARGRGPSRLVVAETAPDGFLTISTWHDWDAIAAATGASMRQPVRTREQHRLRDFTVHHYELLPD